MEFASKALEKTVTVSAERRQEADADWRLVRQVQEG